MWQNRSSVSSVDEEIRLEQPTEAVSSGYKKSVEDDLLRR